MFKPIYIYALLVILFLVYSFSIYLKPSYSIDLGKNDATEAAQGRLVWQKYNCQSCHQLYGLGGYLGPDLTNVYSNKGDTIIRAMLVSGSASMPAFSLSNTFLWEYGYQNGNRKYERLIQFFKQTDASGQADYKSFSILPNGMIEQK